MLKEVRPYVEKVLEDYPDSRNNNLLLFCLTCEHIAIEKGMTVQYMPMIEFARNHDNKFPTVESVTRLRRSIVRARPELAGTDEIEAHRVKLEKEYHDYTRSATV